MENTTQSNQGASSVSSDAVSGSVQAPSQSASVSGQQSDQSSGTRGDTQQDASAALLAKLQGVSSGETTGSETAETGTPGDDAPGETVDDLAKANDAPKLDPELARYAEAKGFTTSELSAPGIQRSLLAQREMEANMNRLQNEIHALKESGLQKAAEELVPDETGTQGGAQELSPLEELDRTYEAAMSNLAAVLGCQSVQELQERFPEAYRSVDADYQAQHRKALRAEIGWDRQKRERDARKTEQQRRISDEIRRAKDLYLSNISELKVKDPEIEANLLRSGTHQFVQTLCKTTGIPFDFVMADKSMMTFAAKASKALVEMENIDKPGGLRERIKKQLLDDAKRVGEVSLPSPDHDLSPEDSILRRLSGVRR